MSEEDLYFYGQHEKLFEQLGEVLATDKSKDGMRAQKSFSRFQAKFLGLEILEQRGLYVGEYNKNRFPILIGKGDEWIRNTKREKKDMILRIKSKKESKKEEEGRKRTYQVNLSEVYRLAVKNRDEAEITLKEEEWSTSRVLLYPDTIRLHLLRIWATIDPRKEDRDKLGAHAGRLAADLRSGNAVESSDSTPSTSTPSTNPLASLDSQAITGMMRQLGVNPSTSINTSSIPEGSRVMGMIEGFISDPKTKDTLSSTFDNLRSAKSLEEMIGAVVSGFQSGGLLQQVQGLAQGMSQGGTPPPTEGTSASTSTPALIPSPSSPENPPLLSFPDEKQ